MEALWLYISTARLIRGRSILRLVIGRAITAGMLISVSLAGCTSGASVPKTSSTLQPHKAYQLAFHEWASGTQVLAEQTLAESMQRFPQDQQIVFFLAACTRSRWEIEDAYPLLRIAEQLDPRSPDGLCAKYVANIDSNSDINGNFDSLRKLSERHIDNVVILWMVAVECRQLERLYYGQPAGDQATLLGVAYYRKLCERIPGKGPSLVHQTYGNVLYDSGDAKDAAKQHSLAVEEEPADWSCSALIADLEQLGQYAEAQKLRSKYQAYLSSQ